MNEKLVKAFDILTEGCDYKTAVGDCVILLVHMVDVAERLSSDKLKRIDVLVDSSELSAVYQVSCFETTRPKEQGGAKK